ncbi:hypothetical protein IJF91_03085 [Candidatus Saccharibacteria bacterium]|nr:hypothetical protein [Candidatus Saccharibacteria bacterium]
MPLKAYFNNGILSEKSENITSGFIQAVSIGLVRYLGNSREAKSGAEIPTSVLLSSDGSEKSKEIIEDFKDALEMIGLEVGDAKNLEKDGLKFVITELKFDAGIFIEEKFEDIEIEIFERGDEIGGLEASLPGGVNFKGKVKKSTSALPIPQIAVNQIEHALNIEIGLDNVGRATLARDLEKEAKEIWEKHRKMIK